MDSNTWFNSPVKRSSLTRTNNRESVIVPSADPSDVPNVAIGKSAQRDRATSKVHKTARIEDYECLSDSLSSRLQASKNDHNLNSVSFYNSPSYHYNPPPGGAACKRNSQSFNPSNLSDNEGQDPYDFNRCCDAPSVTPYRSSKTPDQEVSSNSFCDSGYNSASAPNSNRTKDTSRNISALEISKNSLPSPKLIDCITLDSESDLSNDAEADISAENFVRELSSPDEDALLNSDSNESSANIVTAEKPAEQSRKSVHVPTDSVISAFSTSHKDNRPRLSTRSVDKLGANIVASKKLGEKSNEPVDIANNSVPSAVGTSHKDNSPRLSTCSVEKLGANIVSTEKPGGKFIRPVDSTTSACVTSNTDTCSQSNTSSVDSRRNTEIHSDKIVSGNITSFLAEFAASAVRRSSEVGTLKSGLNLNKKTDSSSFSKVVPLSCKKSVDPGKRPEQQVCSSSNALQSDLYDTVKHRRVVSGPIISKRRSSKTKKKKKEDSDGWSVRVNESSANLGEPLKITIFRKKSTEDRENAKSSSTESNTNTKNSDNVSNLQNKVSSPSINVSSTISQPPETGSCSENVETVVDLTQDDEPEPVSENSNLLLTNTPASGESSVEKTSTVENFAGPSNEAEKKIDKNVLPTVSEPESNVGAEDVEALVDLTSDEEPQPEVCPSSIVPVYKTNNCDVPNRSLEKTSKIPNSTNLDSTAKQPALPESPRIRVKNIETMMEPRVSKEPHRKVRLFCHENFAETNCDLPEISGGNTSNIKNFTDPGSTDKKKKKKISSQDIISPAVSDSSSKTCSKNVELCSSTIPGSKTNQNSKIASQDINVLPVVSEPAPNASPENQETLVGLNLSENSQQNICPSFSTPVEKTNDCHASGVSKEKTSDFENVTGVGSGEIKKNKEIPSRDISFSYAVSESSKTSPEDLVSLIEPILEGLQQDLGSSTNVGSKTKDKNSTGAENLETLSNPTSSEEPDQDICPSSNTSVTKFGQDVSVLPVSKSSEICAKNLETQVNSSECPQGEGGSSTSLGGKTTDKNSEIIGPDTTVLPENQETLVDLTLSDESRESNCPSPDAPVMNTDCHPCESSVEKTSNIESATDSNNQTEKNIENQEIVPAVSESSEVCAKNIETQMNLVSTEKTEQKVCQSSYLISAKIDNCDMLKSSAKEASTLKNFMSLNSTAKDKNNVVDKISILPEVPQSSKQDKAAKASEKPVPTVNEPSQEKVCPGPSKSLTKNKNGDKTVKRFPKSIFKLKNFIMKKSKKKYELKITKSDISKLPEAAELVKFNTCVVNLGIPEELDSSGKPKQKVRQNSCSSTCTAETEDSDFVDDSSKASTSSESISSGSEGTDAGKPKQKVRQNSCSSTCTAETEDSNFVDNSSKASISSEPMSSGSDANDEKDDSDGMSVLPEVSQEVCPSNLNKIKNKSFNSIKKISKKSIFNIKNFVMEKVPRKKKKAIISDVSVEPTVAQSPKSKSCAEVLLPQTKETLSEKPAHKDCSSSSTSAENKDSENVESFSKKSTPSLKNTIKSIQISESSKSNSCSDDLATPAKQTSSEKQDQEVRPSTSISAEKVENSSKKSTPSFSKNTVKKVKYVTMKIGVPEIIIPPYDPESFNCVVSLRKQVIPMLKREPQQQVCASSSKNKISDSLKNSRSTGSEAKTETIKIGGQVFVVKKCFIDLGVRVKLPSSRKQKVPNEKLQQKVSVSSNLNSAKIKDFDFSKISIPTSSLKNSVTKNADLVKAKSSSTQPTSSLKNPEVKKKDSYIAGSSSIKPTSSLKNSEAKNKDRDVPKSFSAKPTSSLKNSEAKEKDRDFCKSSSMKPTSSLKNSEGKNKDLDTAKSFSIKPTSNLKNSEAKEKDRDIVKSSSVKPTSSLKISEGKNKDLDIAKSSSIKPTSSLKNSEGKNKDCDSAKKSSAKSTSSLKNFEAKNKDLDVSKISSIKPTSSLKNSEGKKKDYDSDKSSSKKPTSSLGNSEPKSKKNKIDANVSPQSPDSVTRISSGKVLPKVSSSSSISSTKNKDLNIVKSSSKESISSLKSSGSADDKIKSKKNLDVSPAVTPSSKSDSVTRKFGTQVNLTSTEKSLQKVCPSSAKKKDCDAVDSSLKKPSSLQKPKSIDSKVKTQKNIDNSGSSVPPANPKVAKSIMFAESFGEAIILPSKPQKKIHPISNQQSTKDKNCVSAKSSSENTSSIKIFKNVDKEKGKNDKDISVLSTASCDISVSKSASNDTNSGVSAVNIDEVSPKVDRSSVTSPSKISLEPDKACVKDLGKVFVKSDKSCVKNSTKISPESDKLDPKSDKPCVKITISPPAETELKKDGNHRVDQCSTDNFQSEEMPHVEDLDETIGKLASTIQSEMDKERSPEKITKSSEIQEKVPSLSSKGQNEDVSATVQDTFSISDTPETGQDSNLVADASKNDLSKPKLSLAQYLGRSKSVDNDSSIDPCTTSSNIADEKSPTNSSHKRDDSSHRSNGTPNRSRMSDEILTDTSFEKVLSNVSNKLASPYSSKFLRSVSVPDTLVHSEPNPELPKTISDEDNVNNNYKTNSMVVTSVDKATISPGKNEGISAPVNTVFAKAPLAQKSVLGVLDKKSPGKTVVPDGKFNAVSHKRPSSDPSSKDPRQMLKKRKKKKKWLLHKIDFVPSEEETLWSKFCRLGVVTKKDTAEASSEKKSTTEDLSNSVDSPSKNSDGNLGKSGAADHVKTGQNDKENRDNSNNVTASPKSKENSAAKSGLDLQISGTEIKEQKKLKVDDSINTLKFALKRKREKRLEPKQIKKRGNSTSEERLITLDGTSSEGSDDDSVVALPISSDNRGDWNTVKATKKDIDITSKAIDNKTVDSEVITNKSVDTSIDSEVVDMDISRSPSPDDSGKSPTNERSEIKSLCQPANHQIIGKPKSSRCEANLVQIKASAASKSNEAVAHQDREACSFPAIEVPATPRNNSPDFQAYQSVLPQFDNFSNYQSYMPSVTDTPDEERPYSPSCFSPYPASPRVGSPDSQTYQSLFPRAKNFSQYQSFLPGSGSNQSTNSTEPPEKSDFITSSYGKDSNYLIPASDWHYGSSTNVYSGAQNLESASNHSFGENNSTVVSQLSRRDPRNKENTFVSSFDADRSSRRDPRIPENTFVGSFEADKLSRRDPRIQENTFVSSSEADKSSTRDPRIRGNTYDNFYGADLQPADQSVPCVSEHIPQDLPPGVDDVLPPTEVSLSQIPIPTNQVQCSGSLPSEVSHFGVPFSENRVSYGGVPLPENEVSYGQIPPPENEVPYLRIELPVNEVSYGGIQPSGDAGIPSEVEEEPVPGSAYPGEAEVRNESEFRYGEPAKNMGIFEPELPVSFLRPAAVAEPEVAEGVIDDGIKEAEKRDHLNPAWDFWRKLDNDKDRYRGVRMAWKNTRIPNPKLNLSIRNSQRRNGFVPPEFSLPRINANDDQPTIPCEVVFQSQIEENLQIFDKKINDLQAMMDYELQQITLKYDNIIKNCPPEDIPKEENNRAVALTKTQDYFRKQQEEFMIEKEEKDIKLRTANNLVVSFHQFYDNLDGEQPTYSTHLTPTEHGEILEVNQMLEDYYKFYKE